MTKELTTLCIDTFDDLNYDGQCDERVVLFEDDFVQGAFSRVARFSMAPSIPMLRALRHVLAVWMLVLCDCPRAQELAEKAPDHFDFGKLTLRAPIEHTFHFRNDGAQTLEIANVQLTPPLIAVGGTGRIAPGEEGSITVRLEQPREKGSFQGEIVVAFEQPAAQSASRALSCRR